MRIDSIWAFQRYVQSRLEREDVFEYALWGITQIAEVFYEWICENYPNAILSKMIDMSAGKKFHGIVAERTDMLNDCVIPVFVTAGSANPVAEDTFKKYGVKEYVICYNHLYIVNGEKKTY